MICHSCGGILGRDCFNPSECAWIAHQMELQAHDDVEQLRNELNCANQTILTLQLANEHLQFELTKGRNHE